MYIYCNEHPLVYLNILKPIFKQIRLIYCLCIIQTFYTILY